MRTLLQLEDIFLLTPTEFITLTDLSYFLASHDNTFWWPITSVCFEALHMLQTFLKNKN